MTKRDKKYDVAFKLVEELQELVERPALDERAHQQELNVVIKRLSAAIQSFVSAGG